MTDDLTPQQLLETPVAQPGAPILQLEEIQGDILIGLQKNFERFLFFQIADAPGFKSVLRSTLTHRITTTRDVQLREFQLRDHKNHGNKNPLPNIGVNISLTASGLQKLVAGVNTNSFDPSFAAGAITQAKSLGDPLNGAGGPDWLPDFLSGKIDGVLLITGGTENAVNAEAKSLLGILGKSVALIHDQTANVRPGAEKGHEHFGWQDGISQPGVNGLTTPFPGQQMVDPGVFVFGYPGQPAPPQPAPPSWIKNGSLMVFRRLKQLVPEFGQFISDQASSLGADPVILGARLVGRWKSGAPLALTPSQDDTTLAVDPQQNNNFDFSDDQGERRCPFGAHIRKTNPRTDLAISLGQPASAPSATLQDAVSPRRVMRAGIPYGPEVSDAETTAAKSQQDRGLMFVCYQTSIVNQFEFLQISWADAPGFVFNKKHPDGSNVTVGTDPVIGQKAPGQARVGMDEPVPNYPTGNTRSTLQQPQAFVVPTGGAYFFVPSISALQNELSA
jgi:Dyp-type peroxidase family